MKQNEAESLARKLVSFRYAYPAMEKDGRKLAQFILSGDMKREIENAAFERAAKTAQRFGCGTPGCTACQGGAAAEEILSLIQPSAVSSKQQDREG